MLGKGEMPVEALLRPAVEIWPAVCALACAALCLIAPTAIFLPAAVGKGAAAAFGLYGLVRGRQAWKIKRYHRQLRSLPRYSLRANQIPWSSNRLFLGKGFLWQQKHTQRLHDTKAPGAQRFVQPGALYQWVRKSEPRWEKIPLMAPVANFTGSFKWYNPVKPPPPVGGSPLLHAVEPNENDVYMSLDERNGHTIILGTTRVGKTRLAEILITQDIRRGDVTIVFDPKGDAELMRRIYAETKRAGRGEPYIFHLGYPEHSARYNAIGSFGRVTEVATRVANQLPGEGGSSAFKEFAWRFVNIIARALVDLGHLPDYHLIRRHINDIEPLFVEYAEHVLDTTPASASWRDTFDADLRGGKDANTAAGLAGRSPRAIAIFNRVTSLAAEGRVSNPALEGLAGAFKYDKTYYDKIVSSVGPLMEKLTSGAVAELISPAYHDANDPRPIFDWRTVIRERAVVYIGLDALSDTTVSGAVGNSMFADLVSVAGALYKHGEQGQAAVDGVNENKGKLRICLHADEFNELIGDEFVPMVNKAGGAGFQVTAYTQTWSDVEARIGSAAKAGQVAGNFNTMLMMRVKEHATARMLTDLLGNVEIHSLTQVSGVNDTADPGGDTAFTSRNEDRVTAAETEIITPNNIMSLPKGQAFALVEGSRLYKLRLPLPDSSHDEYMPESVKDLAALMEKKYHTALAWYNDDSTEALLRARSQ